MVEDRNSPAGCRVAAVSSRGERRAFARVERRLQARAGWVEPLRCVQRELLNRGRHPFYDGGRGAEAEFFLATDADGRAVGRIAAIINRRYDRHVAHERDGYFGFFDSVDSPAVAEALLAAAGQWLAARGRTAMRGPASPSEAYEYGLIVEGAEQPHRFMLPHQPAYYAPLLEAAGCVKDKDVLVLSTDLQGERMRSYLERFFELAGSSDVRLPGDITIRSPEIRNFSAEMRTIRELFTEVLGHLWGHCPLGQRELEAMCWSLRHFYLPETLLIAEQAGHPVGVTLTVPDLNEAIGRLRCRGPILEPLELYLRTRRWRPRCVRVLVLGVTAGLGRSLVVPALVGRLARNLVARGVRDVDAHLVLEDNSSILTPLRRYGFQTDRRYRIYRKDL